MEYEVIIARSALRNLEEIHAYIARDNPRAAQAFSLRLLDEAESLKTFPERGGYIVERPGARFVIVHPYLVVYRIIAETRTVRVLRYWHGARERMRMRLE
ncbi:MAG TPA: type II toxin-antitoxin system RelE/ParE family toxin [Chthoniobacteraceae bacterium]|nr:type II toxin-antitoxin system RelE/ParE family toxin [Chthoniobacteraceae bacterium]